MRPRTAPAGHTTPTRWRDLLDHVKCLNKVRYGRIDVLTMAEGSTDFARNLAGENRGQYATVP